jgi:hypothetical protein
MYYGDRKWQGAQALIDSLREEIDLSEVISKAVLETLRVQPILAIEDSNGDEDFKTEVASGGSLSSLPARYRYHKPKLIPASIELLKISKKVSKYRP